MSAATVAKLVAKDAVSTVVNVKPKRTELPTKPDKKVLFSFKIGETVIERSQPSFAAGSSPDGVSGVSVSVMWRPPRS